MPIGLLAPAFWVLGLSMKAGLTAIGLAGAAGVTAGIATGVGVGVGGALLFLKMKNKTVGNGTQSLGLSKSLLFYQDPDNAIIVSSRSHSGGEWITVNVTDQLGKQGRGVEARQATPLAATANPGAQFEAVLYFLDSFNKTMEIRTKDHSLHDWVESDLGTDPSLQPDYFSQLGAHWFNCLPTCQNSRDGTNQVRLFFQKGNKMVGATSSPFNETGFTTHMTPGSGIAAVPFVPQEGPAEMRLFFDEASRIMMMKWKNETSWEFDEDFFVLPKEKTFEGQSIAATSFPAGVQALRPAWFIMVLQLEKNGDVRATYWDPIERKWTSRKKVKFSGGGSWGKITRIAATQDGKFYAIRGKHVEEYTIDTNKPYKFRHSSRVSLRNKVAKVDV